MPDATPPDDPRDRAKRGLNAYAKYSGLAFQMIVPIVIGVFGGRWLDDTLDGGGTYTIVGSLLGIGLALYLPLRELLNKDE